MKLSTYRRIVRYELTVGNSSYGNCAVINMSIFTEIFAVEVADLFAQRNPVYMGLVTSATEMR